MFHTEALEMHSKPLYISKQCSQLKLLCVRMYHKYVMAAFRVAHDTCDRTHLTSWVQSGAGGSFASPISFPDRPAMSSHPSTREPLPFSIANLPIEGEVLPIESSSSPTATPAEEAPQPFGSPSVPVPDAAQDTHTTAAASLDQATSAAAPNSNWDQLWDEGSSDVPDQATSDSPPDEPSEHSASAQHPVSVHQQAVSVAVSQPDSGSHQASLSQRDAPQVVQEALQSAEVSEQTAASSRQLPEQPSALPHEAGTSGSARGSSHHSSTSAQPQEALPEQASPSLLISSWPEQTTTPGPRTCLPDLATPTMAKATDVRGMRAGSLPKTAGGAKEYGSWLTPPLPKGLTPAWLKVKTPAWVKKMRHLDTVSP